MNEKQNKVPSLWDVAKSVLAALLGVQKSRHYERDFTYGKPWQYIVLGIIGVLIFISAIVIIVNIVMSAAGV